MRNRRQLLWRFKKLRCRQLGLPTNVDVRTEAGVRSRVLSGKDDGRALVGGHDHAFYLPTDEDGDGRIDHLTVWAAGGLGTDEVSALYAVREFTVGEVGEVGGLALRTQLVGLGQPSDFRCPLFDTSRTWVSATPFVVSRHLKKRGAKRDPRAWFGPGGRERMEFVRGVAAEEWARRAVDGSRPTIEAFDAREVRARLGWQKSPWEFRRGRSKVGDDGMRRPHAALRISFDEPIAGPLCLGYAAHFGLGLFVPKMPA